MSTATTIPASTAMPAAGGSLSRWALLLGVAFALATVASWLTNRLTARPFDWRDLVAAAVLLSANAICARLLNQAASRDPEQRTMQYLAGHVLRMLGLLVGIVICLVLHLVQPLSFIVAVLAGYACLWLAELHALKQTATRMQG